MSLSKIAVVAGAAFVSTVAAHGRVQNVYADDVWYTGYNPSFQYDSTAPVVVGWSDPEDLSNGYIAPDAYANSDIICHEGATNAMTYANVTAGSDVLLAWSAWPSSHHGPVLDYLAACTGNDCTTVDKTTLEFFKIDGVGLIDDSVVPGVWATDNLIANNNSWAVTIPETLAPGAYVLRHEIIALHSAEESDGAQNYPQCINLWVSGSGTATPSSDDTTLGTALYSETDSGIIVNIYATLSSYDVPGPTQWSAATASATLASYSESPTGGAAATGAVSSAASSASSAATSTIATEVAATSAAQAASVASSTAAAVTSSPVVASSAAAAVVASSSTKASCSKKASSAIVNASSAAAAIVTSAPAITSAAGSGNVVTDEITDYVTVTDIVTKTVTAGAQRRHARDVRA